MSKSIIYIHTTDLGKNDTSTTFVIFNALSLAATGVNVYLLLMNSSKTDPIHLIKSSMEIDNLPENLKINAFHLRRKSKFQFYLFVRSFVRQFDRSALVLSSAHGVLPYLFFLKDRRHSYVFETHDFFYDLSIRDDAGKKTWIRKSRIEQKYLPKLDGIVCLNQHQEKLYRERLNKLPVGIFPTGINRTFIPSNERRKRVVYIGSLDWRMGTDRLASISRLLPKEIQLMIIGGRTDAEIADFKEKAGSDLENLVITGWISKSEMRTLLSEASLALMPHQDVFFSRYMTVPLKMFDYFAYGLPILASDLPTIRDWIDEGSEGIFVDWEKTGDVVELIDDLLNDKEKLQEMSQKVQQKAKGMHWSNRAVNQLKYFKENNWI